MAKLEIRNVSKFFRSPHGTEETLTAIDDLSLSVEQGQFVTVLGPSGCGKTTPLRIVAGLIPLDEGAVVLDGTSVTRPSPKVSVVFQHIGLMPWKSVWDNVSLGLELQLHRGLNASERDEVRRYVEPHERHLLWRTP